MARPTCWGPAQGLAFRAMVNRHPLRRSGAGRCWAFAVGLLATFGVLPTAAQDAADSAAVSDSGPAVPTAGTQQDSLAPIPLILGSDTLGFLFGSTGLLDAEERAEAVLDRLQELRVQRVPGDSVRADMDRNPPVVLAGDEPVLAVTPADARGLGMTLTQAVVAYQEVVRSALQLPLVRDTPRELLVAVGLVLLVTLLLVLSWRLLGRAEPKVADTVTRIVMSRISAIRVQGVEFVSGADIERSLRGSSGGDSLWPCWWSISRWRSRSFPPPVPWRTASFRSCWAPSGTRRWRWCCTCPTSSTSSSSW